VEASTNQVAERHMQLYNLPWKIPCEVMNVELKVLPQPPLPASCKCMLYYSIIYTVYHGSILFVG
jgi:hypothetical protein